MESFDPNVIVIQCYLLDVSPFCLGKMENSLCFQAIITFLENVILSPKTIKLIKGMRVIILQHSSPIQFESSYSIAYLDQQTSYCSICTSSYRLKVSTAFDQFLAPSNSSPFLLSSSQLNSIIIRRMQSRQQIPYTLCVANHYFYMQCLTTNRYFSTIISSSTKTIIANSTNNYLQLNRATNRIQEISKEDYQSKVDQISFTQIIKFYVLLGTMIINHQPYLLVATNVSPIAKYIEYQIYLINDVEFVPYRTKTYQRAEDCQEETKVIEELKKNHINKHFYYSYKENITSSLIQQQFHQQNMEFFTEFAWNSHILSQFRRCNINRCWTIPIIQGFIAEIQSTNKYFSYQYLSISRRSIHMSGTRFNSRGLDEQAHSSNFVETEEIFKCHNEIYVHVSVRGSVPLFWKQVKVRSYIHYSKDKDIDEQAIIKQHYSQLEDKYHAQIATINLLSKQKSPEKELKYRFQALFNRNIKSPYLFFDLNEEMKDNVNGQAKVTKFIQSNIKEFFGDSPFLLMQNITMEIKQHQSVYQLEPYSAFLVSTVLTVWIEPTSQWPESASSSSELFRSTQDSEANLQQKKIRIGESFIRELINIWTTIGNKISEIYCGTASVASHITKKENHTIKTFLGGAIISLNRYINANTTDVFKQQCIDCFLGRRGILSTTDYFNTNICLAKIKFEEYCEFKPFRMNIISFNTNKLSITLQGQQSHYHFLQLINLQESSMIVFHLQEVVQSQRWIEILQEELLPHSFSLLVFYKYQKCDILSIVFVKNQQQPKVFQYKFIQMIEIPLKSYGALALFLSINNTLICLINCKLQSGFDNKSLRLDDFNQIHKFLLAQTYKSHLLKLCEAIFLAGDLNLRLSSNLHKDFKYRNMVEQLYNSSLKSQSKELIAQALAYDEFPLLKASKLIEYSQGEISFLPTYKWYAKKAGFDRMKLPAWCDRILYSNGLKSETKLKDNIMMIGCKTYRRIQENYGSTHKGVLCQLQFSVKQQKIFRKKQLIDKYLCTK